MYSKETYQDMFKKYATLPNKTTKKPKRLLKTMVNDLFAGVPLWRSPYLHYNVGAAPNRVSSALSALAMDLNVFNINDGLSGNTIIAEHATTKILSDIAGIDYKSSCGFFTFGGTATNLYAVKLALAKVFPDSRKKGIPSNVKVVVTEDAHFSHMNALNWLGIGVQNAIVIKANNDRTSNIDDARTKISAALSDGYTIPIFILNGGTTYDNAVDDIATFVELRNEMVQKHALGYTPQIHVDAVIGWAWLFFKEYDFKGNPLGIEDTTLQLIAAQYNKIKHVKLADSWGVDFHKGVGTCPIPSSVVMINDRNSASLLSYKDNMDTHQLAREFSTFSPVDYTLETSRPAASSLAAIGALHALGIQGYQFHLANLIQQNQLLRELLSQRGRKDIFVINDKSVGYVTMLQVAPKGLCTGNYSPSEVDYKVLQKVTDYTKAFFTYDMESRMKKGNGVEYSYSGGYVTTADGVRVGAIKFYPTSPYLHHTHIENIVTTLCDQKDAFDAQQDDL
jgi:glutamate/tyrosine decarboxylase-like PLP-dependent enzyme